MLSHFLRAWILPATLMATFSVVYFLPYYQGYRFRASDQVQLEYMTYPLRQVREKAGRTPFWAPHLFSGMPSYLIWYEPEGVYFSPLWSLLGWIFGKVYPSSIFFMGMLGFFIFLRVEGASPAWALAGAFGFILTSYYTNMIVATHWGKSNVLFSVPYVLAGMACLHRRRWGPGLLLALVGWAGMVGGHHPQMAYYALAVLAAYELAWAWTAWRAQQLKPYLLSLGLLVLTAGAGGLSQIANLLPYYEYGKYSIRGGSELERDAQKDPFLKEGLDREYAQSYSASRAELWTLIIPDFVGGTSQEDLARRLGSGSALREAFQRQGIGDLSFLRAVPAYWGGSPFAAGSFYVGAIWFFLTLLGWMYGLEAFDWILLYVSWAILQLSLGAYGYSLWATAVLFLLPYGAYRVARPFQAKAPPPLVASLVFLGGWGLVSLLDGAPEEAYKFTDLALEYFPFYNKFRAPSTWLVTMGILLVGMGIRGAIRFLAQPDSRKLFRAALTAAGIIGLVGLGASWLGFSFEGSGDVALRQQASLPEWFFEALREDRVAIARQSALRSLLWVALAVGALWGTLRTWWRPELAGGLVAVFAVADGWLLNSAYFPRRETYIRQREVVMPPPREPYEEFILADTVRPFRVLPFHTQVFTDARPAVYLESAGGYHPAKLKRYQQLIETHLSALNPEVLRMLAIRYITARPDLPPPPGYDSVAQTSDGVRIYRHAGFLPMAWLSPFVRVYPRLDQTLDSLGRYPVHTVSLVAQRDWDRLSQKPSEAPLDSSEGVQILHRSADKLEYRVQASRPRLLVLSEIYYFPDWQARVDGQEVPLIAANFVLRALVVPAGEHLVELVYQSQVAERSAVLSRLGSLIAWTLVVVGLGLWFWKRRQG